MTTGKCIQVGVAGWSNPPALRAVRPANQSHLAYYAAHFGCVEINSSFYKSHRPLTYQHWRDETPDAFRFSVKMPRSITHESQLKRCAADVARFYDETLSLGPKLAVVLIQLPPSLPFTAHTVRAFFGKVPNKRGVRIACEPRHVSWFTQAADCILAELGVVRVAADPPRVPGAQVPAGAPRFAYFRWHGSPSMYYSAYGEDQLADFASAVTRSKARKIWCVFDNTARYAAWDDALRFMALLPAPRASKKHIPARAPVRG